MRKERFVSLPYMKAPGVVPLPETITPGAGTVRIRGLVLDAGDTARGASLRDILGGIVHSAPGGPDVLPVRVQVRGGNAESYRLTVSATGIEIDAADEAGAYYATHTLRQLLDAALATDGELPLVEISDRPRFRYRGLMIDVARHFFPPGVLRRVIRHAASLKLNHVHLHLSDDQGWRLDMPSRPRLATHASTSAVGDDHGGYLTTEDYRALVSFAADHHVTIVPEIDMPGHTHAVGLAYPELAEPPAISPALRDEASERDEQLPEPGASYQGLGVGFSSLRIGAAATTEFVDDILDDLTALTPGPYLHIGGDEALGTPREHYDAFLTDVSGRVTARGKIPITWHEAGETAGLAPGTIGQYWGFSVPTPEQATAASGFVERGGSLILSPADLIYLDMKYADDDELGLVWAQGPTTIESSYTWEPGALLDIPKDAILGVEAAVWTETIRTETDLETMIFPRLAAAAEAAWSPPLGNSPERSWPSFQTRAGALTDRWRAQGIAAHAMETAP